MKKLWLLPMPPQVTTDARTHEIVVWAVRLWRHRRSSPSARPICATHGGWFVCWLMRTLLPCADWRQLEDVCTGEVVGDSGGWLVTAPVGRGCREPWRASFQQGGLFVVFLAIL
ncbi:hypothetical protein TIFTF001_030595 [Ficus carica]|uniref:Uncharacterized protein n=1 Tax=Ficus carica TaxID=3494 RepID=A0AA88DTN6_FICCA|nr:hypothetical protein TIFTF001_030595 [Ficus carica]